MDDEVRLAMTVDAAEQMLAWMKREGESLTMAVRHCGFTGADVRRLLDALIAQATELAALRARVEEATAIVDEVAGYDTTLSPPQLAVLCNNLRAALAPRQTTGDEHG